MSVACEVLRASIVHRLRHALPLLAAIGLAPSLSGCGLVGLGIGAAIPKYERVRADSPLDRGTRVELRTAPHGEWTKARYESSGERALTIDTDDGWRDVPLEEVKEMRIQRGTYWLPGMLFGGLLDIAVIGAIATTRPWQIGNVHGGGAY